LTTSIKDIKCFQTIKLYKSYIYSISLIFERRFSICSFKRKHNKSLAWTYIVISMHSTKLNCIKIWSWNNTYGGPSKCHNFNTYEGTNIAKCHNFFWEGSYISIFLFLHYVFIFLIFNNSNLKSRNQNKIITFDLYYIFYI
jgi:hypothetical protein